MSTIVPEAARNLTCIGHSDLAGRSDCMQVMVNKDHAFIGNIWSAGVSVLDVRDPRLPTPAAFLPCHQRSWAGHLQTFDDLMLVCEEFNFYSVYKTEEEYYGSSIKGVHSSMFGESGKDYSAGLRVYDIADPAHPRPIGFMPVAGLGLHRVWWIGGRHAYASAILDGFTDHILISIDLSDPTNPVEAGRWWLPGMWREGGETPSWTTGRVALHHAVVFDGVAYGAWRDGGLTILDAADPTDMKLVAHRNWCPPFAGGTHSPLPLHDRSLLVVADEAVGDISVEPIKHTWVFDIRVAANPVSIATMPIPADQDYVAKGGHFGPHNLWENRPDGFVSSTKIIETYQNAGVRVFDIRNPFRPEEIAYFVPPPPTSLVDDRPEIKKVIHAADAFVDRQGRIFLTDFNAGLFILDGEQVLLGNET